MTETINTTGSRWRDIGQSLKDGWRYFLNSLDARSADLNRARFQISTRGQLFDVRLKIEELRVADTNNHMLLCDVNNRLDETAADLRRRVRDLKGEADDRNTCVAGDIEALTAAFRHLQRRVIKLEAEADVPFCSDCGRGADVDEDASLLA